MARILIDTSALYALIDRDDANHRAARAGLERLRKRHDEPLLTNFIVAESHALLMARLGSEVARRWLASTVWPVERITEQDEDQARAIVLGHADKGYSYTDATSFSIIHRLRLRAALAFDRHFRQFGIPAA